MFLMEFTSLARGMAGGSENDTGLRFENNVADQKEK